MFQALFAFLSSPGIAAGISAGSAVLGLVQGQKSAEAQKKAQEAQAKQSQLEAHRARIQAVREARIKRASILAADADMGGATSGIAGGVSSIASQLGSNIGFQNQREQAANSVSMFNQQAIDAGSSSEMFYGIAKMSAPSMDGWQKIFGGGTTNDYQKLKPSFKVQTPTGYGEW